MDYLYLRAWDKMMGSSPGWCADNLRKARETQAPDDAVYWKSEGGWVRFSEVTSADTRRRVEALVIMIKENNVR